MVSAGYIACRPQDGKPPIGSKNRAKLRHHLACCRNCLVWRPEAEESGAIKTRTEGNEGRVENEYSGGHDASFESSGSHDSFGHARGIARVVCYSQCAG